MNTLRLLLICTLYQCCFANTNTTGQASADLQKAAALVPLKLKLPAPSLKWNGPLDFPIGPNIEPLRDKPREPFLVPARVTNLALGRPVTASVKTPLHGTFAMVTDGEKEAFDFDLVEIAGGMQWVQVDLEQEHEIYAIVVWHNHIWPEVFKKSVVVQAADDAGFAKNVGTLFNNDYENLAGLGAGTDKLYFENYDGKLIDAKGIKARHLRFYSNGSNKSPLNSYQEIEAWGLPVR
jgi:hypothetical protein